SGTYGFDGPVTLSCTTPGASIHYTTNGLEPTQADPAVTTGGTVPVSQSLTLQAKAWASGLEPSVTAVASYTLQVPYPRPSLWGGIFSTPQSVIVTSSLAGVTIHFTTNGIEPTQSDPVVVSGSSVAIDVSATLKVRGYRPGWLESVVASLDFVLEVGIPELSPGTGSHVGPLSVQLTTATPDVPIHYTTTGLDPTPSDPSLASGDTLLLGATTTLKAKAWRSGWTDSVTAHASYYLALGTVSTPSLSPVPGSYLTPQSVTLACATPGAVLRYTLDGSDPHLRSPIYTAPVLVDATSTLRVKGFKADWVPSLSAVGAYQIDPSSASAPIFSPEPGRFAAAQTVTITSATPGAQIHYTTNGLEPTQSDPVIVSGSTIRVGSTTRLMAKTFEASLAPSAVRVGDYVLTGAIATGGRYGQTLVLRADGGAWTWGNAMLGLGSGGLISSSLPIEVDVLPAGDVAGVAVGYDHSLALLSDGTVWAWGAGNNGQLGDGACCHSVTMAVQVMTDVSGPSYLSDVVAVAAGHSQSLALRSDGTVWAWGNGGRGQLGDGTKTNRSTAIQVPGLSGVTQIAAGDHFSAAIKTDGTGQGGALFLWGRNDFGQLGDGSYTDRTIPMHVLSDVVQVTTGVDHTLAITADGVVWSWGDNGYGQLGDGSTNDRAVPGPVPGLGPGLAVAGGGDHSLAALQDGSSWSFGRNHVAQLCDGSRLYWNPITPGITTSLVPVHGVRPGNVQTLSAWLDHSVVLSDDGMVWTCGQNRSGQLGDGDLAPRERTVAYPVFSLTSDSWGGGDPDADGLSTQEEVELGTDPLDPDSNADGILDGAAVALGLSPSDPDMDGDGVSNAAELAQGSDPFMSDTDGDGVADAADAYPLDPTRWQAPTPDPGDTTAPVITLEEPTNAVLISSVP
ncbi:MAG: chitobiase/beta-hexosaminidase C-terminal domain-containing protein, partial [Dehalococcoidia bacterium]